ncbi:hybrid sensor histidine kinase/response regulator [Melaminivora suipulveris]|uniref:histidine kinase n=1 Tax=Melaminivora suipulveris TaxID=2109913 RepID=A0A2R3QFS8_9BURK|nr:ATP-binding protein [Melaminivora suipulveris]AVO50544.1 hybrid sensor histidine kinase/response regulator [Melaminivora suipulveris]
MSGRIREFDWQAHPLGPPDSWPPELRGALEVVLACTAPACLIWGRALSVLPNDACLDLPGISPGSLGGPCATAWRALPGLAGAAAQCLETGLAAAGQLPGPQQRSYTLNPVRDAQDRVAGAVLFFAQEARTALQDPAQAPGRASDRDRLWELSDALMVVLRFDATIVAVNPAWSAALGWSEDESVGRHLTEFVYDGDSEILRRETMRLRAGAQRRRVRMRFVCSSGNRRLLRTLSWSVVVADGLLHAVGRDETDEMERELQLAATREQLRQSQKVEAIGQLTGGIAHDFNNMLQGILLPLQLMQRRVDQGRSQEVRGYIDAALGSVRRAAALTQRLLAFSRRQPLDVRPTDVAQLLSGLQAMLRSTFGANIALTIAAAPDLWVVRTDPHQLESALLNLAINARDAMPGGGALHVEAANVRAEAGRDAALGRSAREAGEYVRLTVRDSGCGMPAAVVERVFEPFFTTKPAGQGTGLGLSMVYGYMRQTGGAVEIDSQPGRGSSVHLYVPRCLQAAEREEHAPLGAQALLGPRQQVLVVEDDETVRALVVELLGEMGFHVTQAASGTQAVALLAQARHVDLLITDVGLPGPDGRQVAELARERFPGIRVLLMTGYDSDGGLADDLQALALQLLAKPFSASALVHTVGQMMGREQADSPA